MSKFEVGKTYGGEVRFTIAERTAKTVKVGHNTFRVAVRDGVETFKSWKAPTVRADQVSA